MNSRIITILIFFSCRSFLLYAEPDNLSDRVMILSYFIASDEFGEMALLSDHLELVDTIFKRAMIICDDDISEALLTASYATIPYKRFPVVFPLLNEKTYGTIFNMPDSVFQRKVSNLPSDLFFDSPSNSFGDKDKLAHFFGNAFLSYNVALFNLSKFLSILVELFEESFKVDGSVSTRDLLIGNLGELYGRILNEHDEKQPSEFLRYYDLFFIKYTF